VVTEILGWKSAPKPILNVLEAGRNKMVSVLGVSDEIKQSQASGLTPSKIIELYQSISPKEQQAVRYQICTQ